MSKRNGHPVKQWEITFPQVHEEAAKDTWWEKFPPSIYSITCVELHEDGGQHLHMGIVFKKGISKPNLLDYIIAKYPCSCNRIHISPIRVMSQWQDYCKKEDPNVHERGSLAKKTPKYTEDQAMHDVMLDLYNHCEREGDKKRFMYSEEYHVLQKAKAQETEDAWLRENGYLPKDYRS